MNKYLLATGAAALALTAFTAVADDTAAKATAAPEEPKKKLWDSSASLGLTLTRGNSETLLVSGNILTARKWDMNELAFGADGTYGEDDGEKNAASAHGFGQYNRLFGERWFGYFRADALNDAIADIQYRVALSPGIGYYFIKNDKTLLSAEFGPGYVFEKVGGDTDNYLTLRLAERFEQKLSATAKLWQFAEIVPSTEDFGDYVVTAELGVETAISKSVSLRVVLQDTYRSEPAEGRDSNDLKLIAAVAYKF